MPLGFLLAWIPTTKSSQKVTKVGHSAAVTSGRTRLKPDNLKPDNPSLRDLRHPHPEEQRAARVPDGHLLTGLPHEA
jgi:hypothetical protein